MSIENSENPEESAVETPVGAETPEGGEVEAQGLPAAVPYDRFSNVIGERNQERDARIAAEARAQAIEQAYNQLQSQLNQRAPAPQQNDPLAQFTDPNTRALAEVILKVNQVANAPLNQRIQEITDRTAATDFWKERAHLPADIQTQSEAMYKQYQHLGIDRLTALKQVLGDRALASPTQPQQTVQSNAAQVRAQNALPAAALVPPAARVPSAPVDKSKLTVAQYRELLIKQGTTNHT